MNILVRKAKKHDQEAFAELMRENAKSMYKVAKAILKNDEDAADAMQETALTSWEKINTLKKDDYFKTWLIRILINNCNAIYKQKMRVVPDENLPEELSFDEEYSNVEWQEFLNFLEKKYRIIIVLYYVEGFKIREIAQMLQVNESTVKGRMVTARKKMESLYQTGKDGTQYEEV